MVDLVGQMWQRGPGIGSVAPIWCVERAEEIMEGIERWAKGEPIRNPINVSLKIEGNAINPEGLASRFNDHFQESLEELSEAERDLTVGHTGIVRADSLQQVEIAFLSHGAPVTDIDIGSAVWSRADGTYTLTDSADARYFGKVICVNTRGHAQVEIGGEAP